jgi:hypothetical protein
MKGPANFNSPTQLALATAGLAGLMVVVAALSPREPEMTPEQQREMKHLAFCRSVIDVVKPDDPKCGKDLPRIRAEIAAEQQKAKQDAAAQAEAQRQASDPERTLTDIEMAVCQRLLRERMKDPSSFRVNRSSPASGGLIDYTATNGFGGPSRAIYQCTKGQNIPMDQ